MEVDINQIAIGVLVALALSAWRWLRRQSFWRRIETRATRMLEDPSVPVDDPKEAAERALLEAQRAQLDACERSIRGGGNGMKPPNGAA